MVTFYQVGTKEEQERIKATFQAGHAMCKASLLTALYAIATFLLVVIHIFTFIVHFSIGVLTILHALGCMARLGLVQAQEATRTPLVCVTGGRCD
jgi:hypothetical protein